MNTRVSFPQMELSIFIKTEMGPELTEMSYYSPEMQLCD